MHYVRGGRDEGVAASEGAAGGVPLSALLVRSPPVGRVVVEVLVAVAEVLCIAHEDGRAHGHLDASRVRVARQGVVAVEGFAEPGVASPADDLYALGRLGVRLLGVAGDAVPAAPGGPEHDARTAAVVLGADVGLPREAAEHLRWLLVNLLAADPARRPDALRVWRALLPHLQTVPGPDLAAWLGDAARPPRAARPAPDTDEATVLMPRGRRSGPVPPHREATRPTGPATDAEDTLTPQRSWTPRSSSVSPAIPRPTPPPRSPVAVTSLSPPTLVLLGAAATAALLGLVAFAWTLLGGAA